MLDVSRDRVPTRETLARLVELLRAAARSTTSSSTPSTPSPTATTRSSGATRRRSPPTTCAGSTTSAASRGIELVANQNCFGHMGRWLRHHAVPRVGPSAPTASSPSPDPHGARRCSRPTAGQRRLRASAVRASCSPTSRAAHGQHRLRRDLRARARREPRAGRGASARAASTSTTSAASSSRSPPTAARCSSGPTSLRNHPALARRAADATARRVCWTLRGAGPEACACPTTLAARCSTSSASTSPTPAGFDAHVAPFARAGAAVLGRARARRAWNSLVGPHRRTRAATCSTPPRSAPHAARPATSSPTGATTATSSRRRSASAPLVYGGAVAWCRDANAGSTSRRSSIGSSSTIRRDAARHRRRRARAPVEPDRHRAGERQPAAGRAAPVGGEPVGSRRYARPRPRRATCVARSITPWTTFVAAEPQCADAELVTSELLQATRLARHGAWRLLARVDGGAPDAGHAAHRSHRGDRAVSGPRGSRGRAPAASPTAWRGSSTPSPSTARPDR